MPGCEVCPLGRGDPTAEHCAVLNYFELIRARVFISVIVSFWGELYECDRVVANNIYHGSYETVR